MQPTGFTDRHLDLDTWTRDRLEALGVVWPGFPSRPAGVVAGVDGLESSRAAVAWARALGEVVHLVHGRVATLPTMAAVMMRGAGALATMPSSQPVPEKVFSAIRADAGEPATEHLLDHDPAEALDLIAREKGVPLMAVGHSGKNALERGLVGSVGERLAQRGTASLLSARTPPGRGPILALVGQDSPGAGYAAAWGARVAADLHRRFLVVASGGGTFDRAHFAKLGPDAQAIHVTNATRADLRALVEDEHPDMVVVSERLDAGPTGASAAHFVRTLPTNVLVARAW